MAVTLHRLTRIQKAKLSADIYENLKTRAEKGPAEPVLDAFIAPLDSLALALGGHVEGKDQALATHGAQLFLLEVADGGVDTWLRHAENYLDAEGRRRHGPHAAAARALHQDAFSGGLAFLDDTVAEENVIARRVLSTLRSPEHQATLTGIKFPMAWLDDLENAVDESDAALAQLKATRDDKRGHIDLGRAAEEDFVDVMSRLRNYVLRTRAGKRDVEKRSEGLSLLAPLLTQLTLMNAEAAARKTRRDNEQDTARAKSSGKSAKRGGTSAKAAGKSAKVAGKSAKVAGRSAKVAGKSAKVAGKSAKRGGTRAKAAGKSTKAVEKPEKSPPRPAQSV